MYDAFSKQISEEMVRTIFMKKWPVQLNETVLNFFDGHRLITDQWTTDEASDRDTDASEK